MAEFDINQIPEEHKHTQHINPGTDTTINPGLWTFKREICNGEAFYPLFRGDQQWGYANEKTFAELMVRALNRDMETHTPAHPTEEQQRIDEVIMVLGYAKIAGSFYETDQYIDRAIALLQAGRK